jgi:peptidoglycan/LPS O-acetylase OafA/YrhL
MASIGEVLDRHKGYGPGFDALRVVLALSILWYHSFVITGAMHEVGKSSLWYFSYMRMPMFFALSGFLVAASALRTNLHQFLLNRLARIIPALAVCTLLCALVIGPIFTTYRLAEYFTDARFYRYFANIILWTQYELPSVFPDHHSANTINLSIWSLPFEFVCYGIIFASMVLKSRGHYPQVICALACLMLIIPVIAQNMGYTYDNRKTDYRILNALFFTRGSLLFPAFLFGSCIYWWRYHIPYSRKLAIACAAFAITMS